MELSDPSTSSDNPLFPKIPLKGANIFSFSSLTMISPFLKYLLKSKFEIISFFFNLKDFVLFGMAVPKLSIFSEKSVLTTSVTIIPGEVFY